jgi:hypothetical protein
MEWWWHVHEIIPYIARVLENIVILRPYRHAHRLGCAIIREVPECCRIWRAKY